MNIAFAHAASWLLPAEIIALAAVNTVAAASVRESVVWAERTWNVRMLPEALRAVVHSVQCLGTYDAEWLVSHRSEFHGLSEVRAVACVFACDEMMHARFQNALGALACKAAVHHAEPQGQKMWALRPCYRYSTAMTLEDVTYRWSRPLHSSGNAQNDVLRYVAERCAPLELIMNRELAIRAIGCNRGTCIIDEAWSSVYITRAICSSASGSTVYIALHDAMSCGTGGAGELCRAIGDADARTTRVVFRVLVDQYGFLSCMLQSLRKPRTVQLDLTGPLVAMRAAVSALANRHAYSFHFGDGERDVTLRAL